jgi:hypothetical protein
MTVPMWIQSENKWPDPLGWDRPKIPIGYLYSPGTVNNKIAWAWSIK